MFYRPCKGFLFGSHQWIFSTFHELFPMDFLSRAILYLCHGTGEHMGRYEKLGTLLTENGFLVYGHDHGVSQLYVVCIPYNLNK